MTPPSMTHKTCLITGGYGGDDRGRGLMNQDELDSQSVAGLRAGWDAQFAAMAAAGDDRLLDPETYALTEWDADEWK